MSITYRVAFAATLATLGTTAAQASCGAAFCNVNTNWSLQGIWTQPGPHVDLRFEYIDQDQPLSDSRKVSVGEVPAHHDEVKTINRNVLATVDYGFNQNWGITAIVPIVDRSHEHIHNHRGEKLLESWHFPQLGDIRVQGRYQTYFGEATADRAGFAGSRSAWSCQPGPPTSPTAKEQRRSARCSRAPARPRSRYRRTTARRYRLTPRRGTSRPAPSSRSTIRTTTSPATRTRSTLATATTSTTISA